MKILFDTNIVLDVLSAREPHVEISAKLFDMVESGHIEGYLCATTITTIGYLIKKWQNKQTAKQAIHSLLRLFSIAQVNKVVLAKAINSDFSDFEDAVLYQAACYVGVEGLVTRNTKDFKFVELPIYTPDGLWQLLQM